MGSSTLARASVSLTSTATVEIFGEASAAARAASPASFRSASRMASTSSDSTRSRIAASAILPAPPTTQTRIGAPFRSLTADCVGLAQIVGVSESSFFV